MKFYPAFVPSVLLLCCEAQKCEGWTDERVVLEDFSFSLETPDKSKSQWNESLWKFEGDAQFNGSEIVLTSATSQTASVWTRAPLDVANWEVEVEFRLYGAVVADGFGFLYTEKPELGRAYGAAVNFTGLVVAVDTFQNKENKNYPCPLVVQVFNGSQTLDLWADGIDTAVVVQPMSLREQKILPVIMKIRYQDYTLSVWLTLEGSETSDVSGPFRIDGVHIPRGYYMGFGAFTGDLFNKHSVVRFEAGKLDGPDDSFIRGLPRIDLLDSIYENSPYAWNFMEEGAEPSKGVALDLYPGTASPIYMARIHEQGRYLPGLYSSKYGRKFLSFGTTESVSKSVVQDLSVVQVLSYRHSRDDVISWSTSSTELLETSGMLDRMVAVGFSENGDLLYVCKAPDVNPEQQTTSRVGVFSLTSGLCSHLNGEESLTLTTAHEFSVLLIPLN